MKSSPNVLTSPHGKRRSIALSEKSSNEVLEEWLHSILTDEEFKTLSIDDIDASDLFECRGTEVRLAHVCVCLPLRHDHAWPRNVLIRQ
jgi:hypothetical protein